MYYEEKMIGGVWYWRNDPEGEWTKFTTAQLSDRYDGACREVRRLKALLRENLIDKNDEGPCG